jgi:hypothetical protein
MSFTGIALTHALARRTGKEPYFFSRFNFTRMKERGNTHFCFLCSGGVGFKPERVGRFIKRDDTTKATNCLEKSGYNPMQKHDASHSVAVIGNAHKYKSVGDWLEKEIGKKKDFPFIVSVPSIY